MAKWLTRSLTPHLSTVEPRPRTPSVVVGVSEIRDYQWTMFLAVACFFSLSTGNQPPFPSLFGHLSSKCLSRFKHTIAKREPTCHNCIRKKTSTLRNYQNTCRLHSPAATTKTPPHTAATERNGHQILLRASLRPSGCRRLPCHQTSRLRR